MKTQQKNKNALHLVMLNIRNDINKSINAATANYNVSAWTLTNSNMQVVQRSTGTYFPSFNTAI